MTGDVETHTGGAYAVSPRLHEGRVGWTASGRIYHWRGSLADVCDAAQVVLDGPGLRSVKVTIGRNTGESETYEGLDAFSEALETIDPESVLTARVDANAGDATTALILLRPQRPAVLVEATSPDPARSLGLAQIIQGRLQRGYSDPFGPGRFIVAMTLALLTFAAGIAITGNDITDWPMLLRILYGVALFAAVLGVLYVSSHLLADKTPLMFRSEPASSRGAFIDRARALWERRRVRWPLTVLWLLFIGVAGNEIADLI